MASSRLSWYSAAYVTDPVDGHRAAGVAFAVAEMRELHGLLADIAGLAGIDVGDTAEERALQIAEGVAADAGDLRRGLHIIGEKIGERAGARQLHVAVGVAFDALGELGGDRRAAGIMDALGNGDHATAELVVHGLHILRERFEVERALRNIDEVRPVVVILAGKR